jgi:hypothetical protein
LLGTKGYVVVVDSQELESNLIMKCEALSRYFNSWDPNRPLVSTTHGKTKS